MTHTGMEHYDTHTQVWNTMTHTGMEHYDTHTGMEHYDTHTGMEHYDTHTGMEHYDTHTGMEHYDTQVWNTMTHTGMEHYDTHRYGILKKKKDNLFHSGNQYPKPRSQIRNHTAHKLLVVRIIRANARTQARTHLLISSLLLLERYI